MQGRLRGVATQIQQDVPQTLPIHCLSHLLKSVSARLHRKVS